MSAITNLIKGGAWLTIASFISKVASAISLPMLARILGPESLGIYTIVSSLVQSACNFSGLGVDVAMHRNGAQYKTLGEEAVGRLFGVGLLMVFSTSIITALGVLIFREPLAVHWLGQANVSRWLAIAAVIIVLQPLGDVPLLFLASLHAFQAYATRSSIGIVLGSSISVALTWRFGLRGAVMGLLLVAFIQISWSYICVKPVLRATGIRLRFDKFWQEALSILRFGFPYYFGNTFLGSVIGLPLMGLVSKYGGLEELGYLRVAMSLAALVSFIPVAIAPATLSYLSTNAREDKESSYVKSVHLRIAWTATLVPASILSLVLPTIINLLFGAAYQSAVVLAWLYLWMMVLACINDIFVKCLVADGRTIRICWASSLSVSTWVIACMVLVPHYSATGFSIGRIISQLVMLGLTIYPGMIAGSSPKDLALIRNLTILTLLLVVSTFYLSTLNFHGLVAALSVVLIGTVSITSLYMGALHSDERLKINHQLVHIYQNRLVNRRLPK
jgi:O-antigen/teichoic acid export membrane protein